MPGDADRRTFLNVNRSVLGRRWVDRLTPAGDQTALAISQSTGLSDLTSRLLAGRGISEHEAKAYLDPSIKSLMPDPYVLTDREEAASRLAHAIQSGETIAIFGDYDVDGATSSALLYRFCSHYGLTPTIYIPDRITEGYGPNPEAIQSLIEDGASLIVTVDCGATSFDALQKAKELGGDVVVLDHHQVGTTLPEARAIVNPNRHDDRSGLGHLAAVGVVFMALVATQRILRDLSSSEILRDPINLLDLLDLVALGTVCDVVPLKTLNRAFVRKGLVAMRNRQNPGIGALSVVSGVDGAIESGHLGFALGPRINAGGRVGDAALGARLLTVADPFEAEDIAGRLDRYNAERQAIEKAILEDAGAQALNELGPDGDADQEGGPAHFIASGEGWHPGVLGIVAARLKERYNRPCFALGFDRSGMGTGSGRSISGVDLGKVVREALDEGVILKGGGHEMAAGLTV
ncbi:MAG: single-stranded-DNA-specific exonuclease RecJ, partial [Pseudomonadota bacterium]